MSAKVESQSGGGIKASANHEDVKLPEESDSDGDDKIEIAQKGVPSAVFGGLIRKRDENEKNGEVDGAKENDNENQLGALEIMKRLKQH
ncbi:pre-mRNA-splicing factor SYF1 [Spatholobus suberectus]|nr:pre-mRNA-splicing factor SYF1 [Spatholobus suberectus]